MTNTIARPMQGKIMSPQEGGMSIISVFMVVNKEVMVMIMMTLEAMVMLPLKYLNI